MFYTSYETSFEAWHLPYAAYMLWVAGLSVFYLIATAREPMELVGQMGQSWLSRVIGIWVASALLVGGFAWPLLIAGPFLVVGMGAPVGTGVIMAAYLISSFCLSGKLLMERWPAVFSQHR